MVLSPLPGEIKNHFYVYIQTTLRTMFIIQRLHFSAFLNMEAVTKYRVGRLQLSGSSSPFFHFSSNCPFHRRLSEFSIFPTDAGFLWDKLQ